MKNNYTMTFNEYLENEEGKFAIVITKQQYAIKTNDVIHDRMISELITEMTPGDIERDSWAMPIGEEDSLYDTSIIIVGYPKYACVMLPQKSFLSTEQYNYLKDILLRIREENIILNKKGSSMKYELNLITGDKIKLEEEFYQEDKIEEVLKQLTEYISDDYQIQDEIIIGTPFNNSNRHRR